MRKWVKFYINYDRKKKWFKYFCFSRSINLSWHASHNRCLNKFHTFLLAKYFLLHSPKTWVHRKKWFFSEKFIAFTFSKYCFTIKVQKKMKKNENQVHNSVFSYICWLLSVYVVKIYASICIYISCLCSFLYLSFLLNFF